MHAALTYFAAALAGVASLLCLSRLLRSGRKPGAVPSIETDDRLSREIARHLAAFLMLFVFSALAQLALNPAQQLAPLATCFGALVTLGFVVVSSQKSRLFVSARAENLRKENTSKIFRYYLYLGGLLGLATAFFVIAFTMVVQSWGQMLSEHVLAVIYFGSLIIFWLRFKVSLTARASDYAFELLTKQEALVALAGVKNPLWIIRQEFSAVNRFLFHHMEFLLLSLLAIHVATQLEVKAAISYGRLPSLALVVFSLGLIASVPGFLIVRVRDKISPETFLWNIRIGHIAAISILAILSYLLFVVFGHLHIKYFWIILVGVITALVLGLYSAIYVSENHRNARSFIAAAATSVSTVIHKGIAAGMRGAAIPALMVMSMMTLAYFLGVVDEKGEDRFYRGLYALALALVAMVSLYPVTQATASIMPLASETVEILRLQPPSEARNNILQKFKILRGVTVPSHALQGQIFLSGLTILIFVVYAQMLAEAGAASLFKHLTHTAMLLLGGIASYFLAARVNELVLNLGPVLVRETRSHFRENPGLDATTLKAATGALMQLATRYLVRKILPLFLGAMLLPGLSCLFGGGYGLAGYLIGFGFFTFLGGTSWLTTGAAWSSARQAAEGDQQISRNTAQLEALTQADIVGDSMHEAAAPVLSIALLTTIVASLMFAKPTLVLHEILRSYLKGL